MDHDITTLQALSLWWQHGEIPKDFAVWGQYVMFWDRLGKILEIVGVLAVAVDVMGAERLATIAAELRHWSQDPENRPLAFVLRPRVILTGVVAISILAAVALLTGPQKIDPLLPFTQSICRRASPSRRRRSASPSLPTSVSRSISCCLRP